MDKINAMPEDQTKSRRDLNKRRSIERFLTARDWREVLAALEADGDLIDSSDSDGERSDQDIASGDISQTWSEFLDAQEEASPGKRGADECSHQSSPMGSVSSPSLNASAERALWVVSGQAQSPDRMPKEPIKRDAQDLTPLERVLFFRGFQRDDRIEASLVEGTEQASFSVVQIARQVLRDLKKGDSLTNVSLPAWLLEPMSSTEKVALAMRHGELLAAWATEPNPFERFLKGIQYFLSGLPRVCSLRKPLNPVLGETFWCAFPHRDELHGITTLFCEQVSHHPPRTAMHMRNNRLGVRVEALMEPRPSFGGNSLKIEMAGHSLVELLHIDHGERYILTRPAMVITGILGIGKQQVECVGKCIFHCPKLGLLAKFDFKGVSLVGLRGSTHAVEGKIYIQDQKRYVLFGRWDECVYLKDLVTEETRLLYDANQVHASYQLHIWMPPEDQQPEKFARRVWRETTDALSCGDFDKANQEKRKVEEGERELRALREESGTSWEPTYFELDPQSGIYVFNERYRNLLDIDANDPVPVPGP
ncbi:Oxysterol binding protein [Cyanidiococcus yangmingshanensis]|uniref:Oxysterol binding protein n=1 Tax=Cyanidiococcus yangmingshanensis TaxID=2690220 RepID=A0A7J7ILF6_9RHOD|nr:Oxysterol binding protein [Cyanidiococcus yangmingshanensis]